VGDGQYTTKSWIVIVIVIGIGTSDSDYDSDYDHDQDPRLLRYNSPRMKRIAVYPGSFDPVTNGHLDIIHRALEFVDELVIAILVNPEKQALFTVKERMEMIRTVLPENPRIQLDQFDGLLVEYARKKNARVIIRGLRAVSDFDYEFQMALMNRRLEAQIETVFLVPAEQYSYVSSRLVKEICALGGAVRGLVPEEVEKRMKKKLQTEERRKK
jgi:pantetheine-phosphate adenylyltransferase